MEKNTHYYTMRVNTNSYIGQKVVSTLTRLKRARHMSYNMLIQESVLMMGERLGQENFEMTDVSEKEIFENKQEKDVNTEVTMTDDETLEKIDNEAMYALLDDAFTDKY